MKSRKILNAIGALLLAVITLLLTASFALAQSAAGTLDTRSRARGKLRLILN